MENNDLIEEVQNSLDNSKDMIDSLNNIKVVLDEVNKSLNSFDEKFIDITQKLDLENINEKSINTISSLHVLKCQIESLTNSLKEVEKSKELIEKFNENVNNINEQLKEKLIEKAINEKLQNLEQKIENQFKEQSNSIENKITENNELLKELILSIKAEKTNSSKEEVLIDENLKEFNESLFNLYQKMYQKSL